MEFILLAIVCYVAGMMTMVASKSTISKDVNSLAEQIKLLEKKIDKLSSDGITFKH